MVDDDSEPLVMAKIGMLVNHDWLVNCFREDKD